MSDLKDELRQERREKEWAETWKPEAAGDMLIGTLEGYDEAATDFGEYTVAHIRDEGGVLRGLWLMHSVLQDEWKEAAPEVGERVGVQYLGQRSGDTYDYHMWTVKVDRKANAGETAGDETPQESDTAGADRHPQKRTGGRKGGKREAGSEAPGGDPKDFDGSDLWGEPALDTEGADTAGSEEAPQESSGPAGDPEGESTLDDPNGELPF